MDGGLRLWDGKMRDKVIQGTLALFLLPVVSKTGEAREWTAKVLESCLGGALLLCSVTSVRCGLRGHVQLRSNLFWRRAVDLGALGPGRTEDTR